MKKYIGTKVIMAEPMTMTEAQKVLGGELKPATLEEDGYLAVYKDGYRSWSPKSVFEGAYEDFYEMTSINFGGAIQALKIGLAVRRKEWKGIICRKTGSFSHYKGNHPKYAVTSSVC